VAARNIGRQNRREFAPAHHFNNGADRIRFYDDTRRDAVLPAIPVNAMARREVAVQQNQGFVSELLQRERGAAFGCVGVRSLTPRICMVLFFDVSVMVSARNDVDLRAVELVNQAIRLVDTA
jgi:hypothetical protein